MYCLYSLSQINAIQSDLQILTSTLLISHLVKLTNFTTEKLNCKLYTGLPSVICSIAVNLIQLKPIVFLSAQF